MSEFLISELCLLEIGSDHLFYLIFKIKFLLPGKHTAYPLQGLVINDL
jgi:hypothetical protein